MIINLALTNAGLYAGCQIEEVAGRLNITTPVAEAVSIVGRNISHIMDTAPSCERVVLTGPMAVWAYLIVFHAPLASRGLLFLLTWSFRHESK